MTTATSNSVMQICPASCIDLHHTVRDEVKFQGFNKFPIFPKQGIKANKLSGKSGTGEKFK
jgi:hypothetical protein